jgi:hypothetical protein
MRRLPPVAALAALSFAHSLVALEAPTKLVDYDIQVALDPATRLVDGTETLRWTNPSKDRVPDLKLHLYWNAFRNDRSTFFKESGGQLRGDEADRSKGWGYVEVTRMTWNGQDLTKGFRFESPDDGNADDRTVLSVALPRPVEPGETVDLQIAWKAKTPRVFARAGYVRDFFFMGQWFPKIGVYEPVGLRRRPSGGWNCHQYHANSEFYADWGDYRVAITVPEKFVVASAGALIGEKRAGGKKTVTYEQKSIHDFAWTTDPRYVLKTETFDPAKDLPADEVARASRLLGRTPEELRQGFHPVKLQFYMQPDHEKQWVRYLDAQKWALAWFGLYAFPYPYAQVSCIDPPEDGFGAAGMEYQTLYTAGTYKWMGRWPTNKLRFPEMVVIHEFGHGYWSGLLASNEFEESWMDEGINSFTEYEMCDRRYRYLAEFPFGVGFSDTDTGKTIDAAHDFDPIVTPAWRFWSGNSYGRNSYPRTATVVNQIRRMVGEERFWRAFRAYAERWRFDHPTSEDFFDAIQTAVEGGEAGTSGASRMAGAPPTLRQVELEAPPSLKGNGFDVRQYRAFIGKTFYGTGFVDYRVLLATTDREKTFTGFDDKRKPVNFSEDEKKKPEKKKKDEDQKLPYRTRVVVGRDGDIVLPVDILLTFANGKTYRTTWDGRAKWIRLSTTYASKLAKVEVDPERKITMDNDPWNNARHLEAWKGPSAAAKVKAYSFHLAEILTTSLWPLGL